MNMILIVSGLSKVIVIDMILREGKTFSKLQPFYHSQV